MTTFICKHLLPDAGRVIVRLSHPATILSVGYQNTQLVLWAIENPEAAPRDFAFHVMTTGRQMPAKENGWDQRLEYIGTAQYVQPGPSYVIGTAQYVQPGPSYVVHVFRETGP